MATDYFGKNHGVEVFNEITLKQFKEEYDKIKNSADKIPVASTILALTDSNGCSLREMKINPQEATSVVGKVLYDCAIFWETAGSKVSEDAKKEVAKKVEQSIPKKPMVLM